MSLSSIRRACGADTHICSRQDEEWTEEEQLHQGFKADEFAFLSEMLGPRGVAFDNDDALDDNDDEDLKNDPVSTMDMRVRFSPVLCCVWPARFADTYA